MKRRKGLPTSLLTMCGDQEQKMSKHSEDLSSSDQEGIATNEVHMRGKGLPTSLLTVSSYGDKGTVDINSTKKYTDDLSSVRLSAKRAHTNSDNDELHQSVNRVSIVSLLKTKQYDVVNAITKKEKEEEEDIPVDDEDDNGEVDSIMCSLDTVAIVPELDVVNMAEDVDEIPIMDIESYNLKDDRDQLYFTHLSSDPCIPETSISSMPRYTEILRYVETLDGAPSFYDQVTQMVVNTDGASFPQLEVINRTYIQQFLRAPNKLDKSERPCGSPQCESLRLSSLLLEKFPKMRGFGLQKGFKCRELILPDTYVKVLRDKDQNPKKHLTMMPNPCFLCHLHYTNRAYWLRKSKRSETSTKDAATMIIHRFVVPVNIPGEYKIENMLIGDDEPMGIIGPFPHYNVNNYIPYLNSDGICAWKEDDNLVFWQPEQQQQRIETHPRSGRTMSSIRHITSRK